MKFKLKGTITFSKDATDADADINHFIENANEDSLFSVNRFHQVRQDSSTEAYDMSASLPQPYQHRSHPAREWF